MNKHGFTLSIYMLVIIIVSLITMLLAIGFFMQGLDSTKEISVELEKGQKIQIDKYLTESSDRVYVPIYEKKMRKKESYAFGMGIKNVLGEKTDFQVHLNFVSAKDLNGNYVNVNDNVNKWIFAELGPYTLEDGERALVELPFRVHETAVERLIYTFKVEATCSMTTSLCDPYGYPQTISIEVV